MIESWYNFGVLYEECTLNYESVVAYKKLLEIDSETNMPERDFFIQSLMYNMIEQAMLCMKFPVLRISNILVIDRKYWKTLKSDNTSISNAKFLMYDGWNESN